MRFKYLRPYLGLLWKAQYAALSSCGAIYRHLRYKDTYFLDTNFVLSDKKVGDGRWHRLRVLSKRLFVTEPVANEIIQLEQRDGFVRICKRQLHQVSFDSLYMENSAICPVYHNFLATMHNPANIFSPDFALQMLFSKINQKKDLSSIENKLHMVLMTRLIDQATSQINEGGNLKTEHEHVIDEAYIRSIKKRKAGLRGRNVNYPNDLRNLALIYTYALLHKENVTFITSDSDAVAYYFDWTASIIQQICFNMQALIHLAKNEGEGMKALMRNEKHALFLDTDNLRREVQGTLLRFYSNHRKYFSPRLTIKYWDGKRKKFYSVGMNIDEYVRELFIHAHGSLNCPSAKNDTMGCFIAYTYWPPFPPHENAVKLLPRKKPVYRFSQHLPFHNSRCLYRRNDVTGNFGKFRTFLD
jgi:hypothetical protein